MADTLLGAASSFALVAHGEQRYGRKPYHAHLLAAVSTLMRFYDWDELPQELVDATWLHDVVEDTDVTVEQVKDLFGPRVAQLVAAVTNPTLENKAARYEMLYQQIRETPSAVVVKLADRIANIEQSISYERVGRKPDRHFSVYLRAWPTFEASLRERCAGEGAAAALMWKRLSHLMTLGADNMRTEPTGPT